MQATDGHLTGSDGPTERGTQCADCRFAQLYAEQDKARCNDRTSIHYGRIVPASAKPCEEFIADTRHLDLHVTR